MATLAWRLRIANSDGSDFAIFSSLASAPNPYLSDPPSGDGQSFDPVTGAPTIAAYRFSVIDADFVLTQLLTDANGRQQVPTKRAYGETTADNGATWVTEIPGFVTAIHQVKGNLFDVTVGASRRNEQKVQLFTTITPQFDATSCLIGGPIRGGFGVVPDYGPWTMRVASANSSYVALEYVRGYQRASVTITSTDPSGTRTQFGPTGGWEFVEGSITPYSRQRIETIAAKFLVPVAPAGTNIVGDYPHLNAHIRDASTGAVLGDFTPLQVLSTASAGNMGFLGGNQLAVAWGGTLPSVGTLVLVEVYPTVISQDSPLHIYDHPVSIIERVGSVLGDTYDTASAATATAALGADLRAALYYTAPASPRDIKTTLFGLFGLSERLGDDGELEVFATRVRDSAAPSVAITSADLRGPGSEPWGVEDSSIITKIVLKTTSFALWRPPRDGADETRPIDDLVLTPVTVEQPNPYLVNVPENAVTYELPGDIYTTATAPLWASHRTSTAEVNLYTFLAGVAAELFDRLGSGLPTGTLPVLRAIDAKIGQLVTLTVDHLPNGNVRGGPRIVQIVKRTNVAGGSDLTYWDAGVNVQPGTQPAITLAADSATDPRSYALVSITNAASLAAAGLGVRLAWAFGASPPADGAGVLLTKLSATDLATVTSVRSARANMGSTVWVQARAEVPGQRPGAWTAWQSVTLTAIAAPSGLTAAAVAGDNTAIALSWTPGASDVPVLVRMKLQTGSVWQDVARLPAGSATTTIHADLASALNLEVVCREAPPYAGESAAATATFTTGGTAPTLAAPSDPVPFAGTTLQLAFSLDGTHTRLDGTYGIEVTPTDQLGLVVPLVAVETAVGSGTPGTFVEQDPVSPAPFLGRTRYTAPPAPKDGKRRYLKALTRRAGAADSGASAVVSVDPWSGTLQRAEDFPLAAPAFTIGYAPRASDAGPQLVARITFTKPTSPYYARTRFTVTPPTGGAFTVEAVDGDPPPEVPLPWGATYQVFAQAITTSGVVGDAGPTQPAQFGLFVFPGFPIGVPIFDPVAYTPTTGAPVAGYMPRGDPSDDTGLTLHDQMQDSAGHNVSDAITTALANAAQAISDAAGAQATADGKVTTFVAPSTAPPTAEGDGDLWIVSDLDNVLRRWNAGASAWVDVRDAGIAQAIGAAADAQSTADSKIVTFYAPSTAPPTADGEGDLWILTDIVGTVKRWNGTAWVVVQSAGALAPSNMLTNGSAELGTVGQAAPGYTFGQGVPLLVTDTAAKNGTRSLSYTHTAADDSFSTVALPVTAGHVYALGGWIKTDAFLAGTSGVFRYGAYLIVQANGQTLTRLDRVGSAFRTTESTANIEVGVVADGAAHDFAFVAVLFRAETTGTVLYTPELFTQDAGTAWIDGVVFEEIPPGTSRYYDALDASGNLNSGVTQSDGVTQRVIAKGHIQGTGRNGNAVTFAQQFQSPPSVRITGGISYEPRSTWDATGSLGGSGGAAPRSGPQYDDMAALDPSTSGFTIRARLRQKGTPTQRTDAYPAGTISTVGASMSVTTAEAPAANDTYVVEYDLTLSATGTLGQQLSAQCTIAIDLVRNGTGTTVGAKTYSVSGSDAETISNSFTGETQQFTASNVNPNDTVAVRIASLSGDSPTVSVDPTNVTYVSTSGDQYASKTPDADDFVTWEAIAVSA